MGKARKAQAAGDLWHLSIDDLLKPPDESPEPAGSGPFVINLSTSTAIIPAPPARMPRFEGLRLYQVQQAHDEGEHGVLFQLRLGIIHSALEADAILASVREHYPGATLDSVTDEDETAVAEATVTQPVIANSAAEVDASAATESKRTNAAPSPSANASGARKAREASAGAQPEAAPKVPASLLPDVPLEPLQEIRWDIDELLPDLPVTRPSQPTRAPAPSRRNPHRGPARKVPAAAGTEVETVTIENPPQASLLTQASLQSPAASPVSEPSQAAMLPLEEMTPEISPPELASSAPALPLAPLAAEAGLPVPVIAAEAPEVSTPAAVAPADEIFASLALLPAHEVSASHAAEPAYPPAAMMLEVLPPEVSIPAAAALAPPGAAEAPEATDAEEHVNFDFDSNADTVEVEALLLIEATSEGLDPELVTSALEHLVTEAPLAPAVASLDDVVFELEYLEPTLLDLPAPKAAPAALSDSELTQEVFFELDPPPAAERMASADSVTVEAPALWRDTSTADGIASAERELSPDSVTVEALSLDIRTPAWAESPWTLNEADADSDAQAMEALAAKINAQPGAETVAAAAVERVFQEPEANADSLTLEALAPTVGALQSVASAVDAPASQVNDPLCDSQTLEEVVAKLDARSAEATLAAAPVRKEDSQTLEVLVAKIGALVQSAEARDSSESAQLAEAVLAERVLTETEPSSHELAIAVEPAPCIDTPLAVVTSTLVESEAANRSVTLAALVEPLVHVEPLEVVEWVPVQAPVASAPATPVASAEPAPTTIALALTSTVSSPNSTTARMRVLPSASRPARSDADPREQNSWPAAAGTATPVSAPASTPAQWPIAPTAKVTPRASPTTLRSASPESAKLSQAQRGHSVPTPALESRPTAPAAPPPQPIAEAAADPETPAFDSTQTIRALTPLELQSGQSSKSFAIQLVLSEEPIHPDQIPNLDIFEAYRLYVVTGFFEERVMHALRLGFFTSEVAAEAVAGYLKGYFDVTCIKRVSLAEHDRFQERRVAARKDVGATGRHAAIELTSRPDLPERRARVQETPTGKQGAPSSIWSRLVSPRKR